MHYITNNYYKYIYTEYFILMFECNYYYYKLCHFKKCFILCFILFWKEEISCI